MNRTTILRRSAAFLGSVAFVPLLATAASAAPQSVTCTDLAAFVQKEAGSHLNKNPISPNTTSITISSTTPVTSKIIPAVGNTLSYCQVVFQLEPFMTIEVGLPLNSVDTTTPPASGVGCNNVAPSSPPNAFIGSTGAVNNSCVQGNWNGKVEAIGNGGFSGSVPGVTGATNLGFIGSSTDNGHNNNECNAINPANGKPWAQPNCGSAFGADTGFPLTPANVLWKTAITDFIDFIDTTEVKQTEWAGLLSKAYYGLQPKRTYWNGCSTGGRQGFQMAQFHPEMFDGILAGAPAYNWNRLIVPGVYPSVVVAQLDAIDCAGGTAAGCANGFGPALTNAIQAANNAAVAACDGNDGVIDGVINEERSCNYDAKALIGVTPPPLPMTVAMTEAEAVAINMIWDGPRNLRGQRLWGGISRGTTFSILSGAFSGNLAAGYMKYWVQQDPTFDILAMMKLTNFATFVEKSDRKFADTVPAPSGFEVAAATDLTDLDPLMAHGTKLLHYRGTNDPLIPPFNSYNMDTRLLERYSLTKLSKNYRSFYYPGNGHCGSNSAGGLGGGNFQNAGLINTTDLFNALINWVENSAPPASITAFTGNRDTGNTTLICPYPAFTAYQGTGPITAATSYACTSLQNENPVFAAFSQTAQQYHEAP
jgi:pimeloyl-ACP methyl ester carboxylesterase